MQDQDVLDAAADIAQAWRGQRRERFARTSLDWADFAALRDAGFLHLAAPVEQGGTWRSAAESLRTVCETLRALAAGDPSPALVAAMHPAVLAFWLGSEDGAQPDWTAQRQAVFATATAGAQWGTITSEPGSGGDVSLTRSTAAPADADAVDLDVPGRRYRVSGDKHFGSGTGISSFMFTTAVPDGEDGPAAFFLDTRGIAADGETPGFTIAAEWDGVGMAATQSHAVTLNGCAGVRLEWAGELDQLVFGAGAINMCLFTGVILGVLDEAMATAREKVGPRAESLRAYEQVTWSQAVTDHWLATQAYEGMLRAVESGDLVAGLQAGLRGKAAVADLAERVLLGTTRVVGGGSFSRSSPFASWFEDVRALGFLRPPWGLMYDGLYATSFS